MFGHSAMHQIIMSNPTFAIVGVRTRTAGGDDDGRYSASEKIVGVIQAGAKHGGGTTSVLGGPKNHDHVSRFETFPR